jgi:hypothetical protein
LPQAPVGQGFRQRHAPARRLRRGGIVRFAQDLLATFGRMQFLSSRPEPRGGLAGATSRGGGAASAAAGQLAAAGAVG